MRKKYHSKRKYKKKKYKRKKTIRKKRLQYKRITKLGRKWIKQMEIFMKSIEII